MSTTPEAVKDRRTRPSLEIYRPPGTRSSDSPPSEVNNAKKKVQQPKETPKAATKPHATAGSKPAHTKQDAEHTCKQNNKQQNHPAADKQQNGKQKATAAGGRQAERANLQHINRNTQAATQDAKRKPKTYSKAKTGDRFEEGESSGKSRANNDYFNRAGNAYNKQYNAEDMRRTRSKTPTMRMQSNANKKTPPVARVHAIPIAAVSPQLFDVSALSQAKPCDIRLGRQLSGVQWSQIELVIGQLDAKGRDPLTSYINGKCSDVSLATQAAATLVEHVIEGCAPPGQAYAKSVAKISAHLLDAGTSPAATAFHAAFVNALGIYYDQRELLRAKHFRYWLTLLNYTCDAFATIGFTYEGELVRVLIRLYNYLLHPSTVPTLRIEELEALITILLTIGYDLERQCPDDVASLRDLIRDAFMQMREPWARKMLLLLVELSASGWKLPTEANEYYFEGGKEDAVPQPAPVESTA